MRIKVRIHEGGIANRIHAIKIVRGLTGWRLRESKHFVDNCVDNTTLYFELNTHDTIGANNLHNIPNINMDIRESFDFTINEEQVIIRIRNFIRGVVPELMDANAPEVLQSAIILFNTVNKHIKQNPTISIDE